MSQVSKRTVKPEVRSRGDRKEDGAADREEGQRKAGDHGGSEAWIVTVGLEASEQERATSDVLWVTSNE